MKYGLTTKQKKLFYFIKSYMKKNSVAPSFEEMMKEKSYNFNLTVYENSYHSFDRESDVSIRENAYDFSDCRLRMNAQGVVFQNFNNIYIPMSTPLLQKIGLALCAKRGPKFGGNPQARKKSFQFSKHFMNQYLLLD